MSENARPLPAGYETPDPSQPLYPGVTVHLSTGCGGNIGAVMAKVRHALVRTLGAEGKDAADQMRAQIFEAGSFTEALNIVMRWVNVT